MIIAVDPGGTTGVTWGKIIVPGEFKLVGAKEVVWSDRFWLFWFIVRNQAKIKRIVVERFLLYNDPLRLRSQIGSNMPSSQVIGIVEAAANAVGLLDKVVYQGAADRLTMREIPKAAKAILGRSNHTEDAYRHLAYFVIINKRVEIE